MWFITSHILADVTCIRNSHNNCESKPFFLQCLVVYDINMLVCAGWLFCICTVRSLGRVNVPPSQWATLNEIE